MKDKLGREIKIGDFVVHDVMRYRSVRTTYGIVSDIKNVNSCKFSIIKVYYNSLIIPNNNELMSLEDTIHSAHNCIICNELYHAEIIGNNLKTLAMKANIQPNLEINRDVVLDVINKAPQDTFHEYIEIKIN